MNLYRRIRNRIKRRKRYKKRLARLAKCGSFQIRQVDGVTVAEGNGLRLGHLFEGDGVLIVEEVFKNNEYDFDVGQESVVIDIGMNIGLASLYFASRDDVRAVYGFEPFRPTHEKALFNFKINERLAHKVHPHNFGLGAADKQLALQYYAQAPGRMSTVRPISDIPHSPKYETTSETVQIRSAAEVLGELIQRHADRKIVLKCDAEGAEKEIFESLNAAGLLADIDVVMAEYHFSHDTALLEILAANGFVSFRQRTVTLRTGDFGMIRAVRA